MCYDKFKRPLTKGNPGLWLYGLVGTLHLFMGRAPQHIEGKPINPSSAPLTPHLNSSSIAGWAAAICPSVKRKLRTNFQKERRNVVFCRD